MSKIISIPRELVKKGDLIIMPRSEYEEFLSLKKIIPLIKPTLSERRAIKRGRKEIQEGKYMNLKQLKNELEN